MRRPMSSLLLLFVLAVCVDASLDKLLKGHASNGHVGNHAGVGHVLNKFGGFGGFGGLSKSGGYYDPYLSFTKSKIDHFLHESDSLGKRKLNVDVDYFNTPLEYLYLNQYHGFNHPLQGTELGYDMGLYNHINHFNTDGYSNSYAGVQGHFRPNVYNPNVYGLQQQQYGPNVYGPAHAPNVYGPNVYGHQQQYGPQQQQYGPQQQQYGPQQHQQYGPNVYNPQQQQQQYGPNVYNPQQRVYGPQEAESQVYHHESQQVYDQGNSGNEVYESQTPNVYSSESRPVLTKESGSSFVTKDHGPQGYVPPSYEFISPVLGHVPSSTTKSHDNNNNKFVNKEYTFGFADFAKAGSASSSASSFSKAGDNKDY